ncbi:acyltransferase family protein [Rhodopseudomonas sp. BR0M22]|uniref:acyltransferase family protein n=1 Tax=Rhodopseudomonas sp. BR0M22 TaxID=2269369 RepID=UPI0013DF8EF9|nr:acyltransferase family protein [Rhodopseudomonas sp. BR0M22]NEW94609.1 acyltransferase [Rhodopseudomonas sp. BR0M22]
MRPAYRSDIDGLRAIAVLLVVGFHAFPTAVRGGFIGVDVFFVISGFLITSIVCQAVDRGDFSFATFYARRINRIFPALLLVLAACAIGGWFLLFPTDYRDAGKAIGFGAAFLANIALLHDSGYFDTSSELNPLLHLWSLGVEEQFYLLWPPVIILAWRWKNGAVVAAVAILVASFATNLLLTPAHPSAAFYLPVTRFWELMTGCLLAIVAAKQTAPLSAVFAQNTAILRNIGAIAGLGLIATGAALIDRSRAFPGWWAVLPVLGAALLIATGPGTWTARRVLGNRAMVYVGLISYPLYLWHWPVLAAVRIVRLGEEPPPLMKLIAVLVAFGLADLTYRFVEPRIRYRPTRAKTAAAFMGVAMVGLIGAGIYLADGVPSRFSASVQIVTRDHQAEAMPAYRLASCFLGSGSSFALECDDAPSPGVPRIALWGDSHAAHLYPGLRALQQSDGGFRLSQYTTAGCPPIFGYVSTQRPDCTAANDNARERLKALKPDVVILVARQWHDYDGPDPDPAAIDTMIKATIAELRDIGVRRIVVVGKFPSWRTPPKRILAQAYRAEAAGLISASEIPTRDGPPRLDRSEADANQRLGAFFAAQGVAFISPTPVFCSDQGCLLAVPGDGTPVTFDGSHLTVASSKFFVRQIAKDLLGR